MGYEDEINDVYNKGIIMEGTFNIEVYNIGEIFGGTFYGRVANNGTIAGSASTLMARSARTATCGSFYGEVANNGTIFDGEFYGKVINNGVIEGGLLKIGSKLENADGAALSNHLRCETTIDMAGVTLNFTTEAIYGSSFTATLTSTNGKFPPAIEETEGNAQGLTYNPETGEIKVEKVLGPMNFAAKAGEITPKPETTTAFVISGEKVPSATNRPVHIIEGNETAEPAGTDDVTLGAGVEENQPRTDLVVSLSALGIGLLILLVLNKKKSDQ